MLDGGIADSIPVRKAITDGFDHNIIILTRRKGYYKEEKNDAVIRMAKIWYRKYPNLIKALAQRSHAYNRTLDLIERAEHEIQGTKRGAERKAWVAAKLRTALDASKFGRLFSWIITDETLSKVIQFFFDRAKAAVKQ